MFVPHMISRTRKGMIIRIAIALVLFIAMTVITYNFWVSDQQALSENGQPSFNTLPQAELKDGLIVTGTIGLAIDVYAEEYKTKLGFRTSDKSDMLYYLIPIYDTDEQGNIITNYFITYAARPGDFAAMDAIVRQTSSGTGEMTRLNVKNARICNLPGDVKGYFTEWAQGTEIWEGGTFYDWCAEYGVLGTDDRAVIESKMAPYMIERTATAGMDPLYIWICLGASVLMLIILLVLIFYKKPAKVVTYPDIMKVKQ